MSLWGRLVGERHVLCARHGLAKDKTRHFMTRTWLILTALIVGLALGITSVRFVPDNLATMLKFADGLGGVWLDALRMTIIPLVVSLLVTGIAKTLDSARGDKVALRSVEVFIALLWISTAMAAMLIPTLLAYWPMPEAAARALASSLGQGHSAPASPPGIVDFVRSIVPTNPVAAAANDALLPLILFTAVFALALARLPAGQREPVVSFFETIGNAMLVVVDWVLKVAPLGVLALAYSVGARAGTSAIGALVHYVLIVSSAGLAAWVLAYPVARFGGKVGLIDFARAVLPAQAVALSTQSSLASLPTMLAATDKLGIGDSIARVSLPIAVAIFRVTSPAMNLAVAIYVAQHAVLRNMVSRKFWRFHPVIGDNREVFRLFRNIGSGYAQASANFIRNPPKIIRDGASNFRLRTGSGKCPNSDRQSSKTVHSNFSQNHLGNCAVIR